MSYYDDFVEPNAFRPDPPRRRRRKKRKRVSYDFNSEEIQKFLKTDVALKQMIKLIIEAGKIFQVSDAITAYSLSDKASYTGGSWERMACVDKLVEMNYLRREGDHIHRGTSFPAVIIQEDTRQR